MAWTSTIDEQDLPLAGGGYLDAPFSSATTFRLAPGAGQKALGLLTADDNDVYSLGVLPVGRYSFTVAPGTWYGGAGFGGTSLPTLGLFSSAGGAPIALCSAAGTLTHQIDVQGTFYVGVLGTAGAPASQYALNYERVAVAEPAALQVQVQPYAWMSRAVLTGVRLESVGQPAAVTGNEGAVLKNGDVDPTIDIAATLPVAQARQDAVDAAITLQDAVAILKMIANQPVNAPGRPLSPYQALAADFDGNGAVSLADALGVLRHTVGLPAATAPRLAFVDEAAPGMPARATTSPGVVPATLAGVTPVNGHVGLVGVLRGDVDGSWEAPAGTARLDAAYFTDLEQRLDAQHPSAGFELSQWGVYPG
jgi:hypothetical protein